MSSEIEDKLKSLTEQLNRVRAQKLELAESKSHARTIRAPPVDHKSKPKKKFQHPKLDFVYGEVAFSPYLTKPLDPYPGQVFSVVEKLRDLKRVGTKNISSLPKAKQPYNPTKIKNIFLNDVINYQVSFLPKGYEKKKQRELELSQSLASVDLGDSPEDDGLPKEKRSAILLANIARGGPEKYKKELKALKMSKQKGLDQMSKAMISVENDKFWKERALEKKRMLINKKRIAEGMLLEKAEEDIEVFRQKAEKIASYISRTERVSSPPHLLKRKMSERKKEREQMRGRSRSPLRFRESQDGRPHTAAVDDYGSTRLIGTPSLSAIKPSAALSLSPVTKDRDMQQSKMLSQSLDVDKFMIKSMNDPIDDIEDATDNNIDKNSDGGDGGGGFLDFDNIGAAFETEKSILDKIAPETAEFGSIDDNADIAEELDYARPNASSFEDRAKTSIRGARGGNQSNNNNVRDSRDSATGGAQGEDGSFKNTDGLKSSNNDENYEDLFPEYIPDEDIQEDQNIIHNQSVAVEENIMDTAIKHIHQEEETVTHDESVAAEENIVDTAIKHIQRETTVTGDASTTIVEDESVWVSDYTPAGSTVVDNEVTKEDSVVDSVNSLKQESIVESLVSLKQEQESVVEGVDNIKHGSVVESVDSNYTPVESAPQNYTPVDSLADGNDDEKYI